MTSLPPQTVSDLRREIAADVHAILLSDFAVAALYRPLGSTEWHGVTVYIGDQGRNGKTVGGNARMLAGSGMAGLGTTHNRHLYTLVAPALGPDETFSDGAAVGSAGGIVRLREGDTIKAPGFAIGREDIESVELRVGKGVDRPGGGAHWNGTVSQ